MRSHESSFYNAILLGAVVGIPALWAAMTVAFLLVTDQSFWNVVGLSAMPAFFCGPFLGGLFTTSIVNSRYEVHEHAARPEVPSDDETLADAA